MGRRSQLMEKCSACKTIEGPFVDGYCPACIKERDAGKIDCWAWKCFGINCGHTNYFMVGGASDIICHGCWNYGMDYLGHKWVTKEEWRRSMFPGDYKNG